MAQNVLTPPDQLNTPAYTGLSQSDVQERIDRGETNDYQARVGRSYWDIFRDNVLNLFNIVLGTLLIIVIAFGEYATAFFAGFSVVTNTFLGMLQEMNAKRKLDNLAALSEQEVQVWRDGELQVLSMRQVVLDDLIRIEPGDKIVVDGVVVESDSLEMDESLLTGESDAIFKQPDDEVYSGSFCIAGTGVMRATRVGKDSNINRLSAIAREYQNPRTPTQIRIDIIVELTVLIMFVLMPMLFISNVFVSQLEFIEAVKNAVVFVTSLVPQGLVLVAILSLTIGAIKISRHETLVQKVNAVESLANSTTLCFDKTGTLTRNELRVDRIISLNNAPKDTIHRDLWQYLHNLAHLNRTAGAVRDFVDAELTDMGKIEKVKEIPFSSGRKWGAVVFEDRTLIMGAPERVLPRTSTGDSVADRVTRLSHQGMRVLAFAWTEHEPDTGKNQISEECIPIALVVLSDTIREDIQDTLQSFRDEGIDLKVISGDSLATVRAIAEQSGLGVTEAYTGEQLDKMSDAELENTVTTANVFARVEPDTKRRIVRSLQHQKRYVAMVGDGVNDVPALKQANLAIVMNDGTQISKDVADIVLLNNAMSTLPLAFKEGKEITQTIFGTMKMFLVKNVYTVLLFVFVSFMSLPFPITPVQISWATFGTVNIPATLIAFGIVRPQYMTHFRRDVLDYIFTGGFIGAIMLVVLYISVYFGSGGDLVTTRSAITVFLTLFGAYIVMSIQGVNFYKPRTFIQHWKIVLLVTVLAVLTIWAMYIVPELFEFNAFTLGQDLWIFLLLMALLALSMIILAHGMKYRYLLRRMWDLFRPDNLSLERATSSNDNGTEEPDQSSVINADKNRLPQESD